MYKIIDDQIFLNWYGFNNYIQMIEIRFLINTAEKIKINKFYQDISSSLITIFDNRFDTLEYINKNKIWF